MATSSKLSSVLIFCFTALLALHQLMAQFMAARSLPHPPDYTTSLSEYDSLK
ncbi:unnamed protein product [Rhodiola kirilowii]